LGETGEELALPQWRQNCRRAAGRLVQTNRNAEPIAFAPRRLGPMPALVLIIGAVLSTQPPFFSRRQD